jgi:hypothetical protein
VGYRLVEGLLVASFAIAVYVITDTVVAATS